MKYRLYIDFNSGFKNYSNGTIKTAFRIIDKYLLENKQQGIYLIVQDDGHTDTPIFMTVGKEEEYLEFKKGFNRKGKVKKK